MTTFKLDAAGRLMPPVRKPGVDSKPTRSADDRHAEALDRFERASQLMEEINGQASELHSMAGSQAPPNRMQQVLSGWTSLRGLDMANQPGHVVTTRENNTKNWDAELIYCHGSNNLGQSQPLLLSGVTKFQQAHFHTRQSQAPKAINSFEATDDKAIYSSELRGGNLVFTRTLTIDRNKQEASFFSLLEYHEMPKATDCTEPPPGWQLADVGPL